ncbi:MAG: hypothetical protein ACI8W8_002541 [Rhodothermales bacterium]|jgi:hypothetical protein
MRRLVITSFLLAFCALLFSSCATRKRPTKYKYGITMGNQYFPYPQYRNKTLKDAKFYGFLTKRRGVDYQSRRAGEMSGRVPIARSVRQISYDYTKNTSCDNHVVLLDYNR